MPSSAKSTFDTSIRFLRSRKGRRVCRNRNVCLYNFNVLRKSVNKNVAEHRLKDEQEVAVIGKSCTCGTKAGRMKRDVVRVIIHARVAIHRDGSIVVARDN